MYEYYLNRCSIACISDSLQPLVSLTGSQLINYSQRTTHYFTKPVNKIHTNIRNSL